MSSAASESRMQGSSSSPCDSQDTEEMSHLPTEIAQRIESLTEVVHQHRTRFHVFEELLNLLRCHKLHRRLATIRRFMSIYLALTESMWLEWFEDEKSDLVHDKDEPARLHRLALADHPMSAVLWKSYLSYMSSTMDGAPTQDRDDPSVTGKSETSRYQAIGLEALCAMQHDFQKSREFWKMYREKCQDSLLSGHMNRNSYFAVFLQQLAIPHAGLDETFTDFSNAVTMFDNDNYEQRLMEGNKIFQSTRKTMETRVDKEALLQDADFAVEACENYVRWLSQSKSYLRENVAEIVASLTRVALRHPKSPSLWLSLYNFVSKSSLDPAAFDETTRLAIRHCSSNGKLWSCRIRAISRCTHDPGQVLEACELALTNFEQAEQSTDIIDVIRSTFLCLRLLANDLGLGIAPPLEFAGLMFSEYKHMEDPFFTLPKLLIAAQTTGGQRSHARDTWKLAAKKHSHQALFWLQYFQWEIGAGEYGLARNAIKTGCFKTSDAPQVVFDAAEAFEIEYGDLTNFDKTRAVVSRAIDDYHVQHTMQQSHATPEIVRTEEYKRSSKHQLDETEVDAEDVADGRKRVRLTHKYDGSSVHERQREFTTVFVRNLSPEVDESIIRRFFEDCGTIRAVNLFQTQFLAIVEFEEVDDALAAETKTLKLLAGKMVIVESAKDTVLFVSNAPPTFTEEDLCTFFAKYGTVLQVRLPSLRFDQARRFAYVQMSNREEARAALASHCAELSDYTLSVALANPQAAKRGIASAAEEQREVFVKKLSWKATQLDIESRFSEYGTVQSIRLPQTLSKNHHDGIAFIVYEESAAATRALKANQTSFQNRTIEVSISQPRGHPRAPQPTSQRNESRRSTQSDTAGRPSAFEIQAKTLGIMNLPDTVNESQLRALFSPFGSLRKVVLRPDHAGAIVEYDDPAAAGTASLALSGREIGHKTMQIGRYEDLMQQKPSRNENKQASSSLTLAPRQTRTAQARRRNAIPRTDLPQRSNELAANQHGRAPDSETQQDTGKKQDFFRNLINQDSTTSEPVTKS